MDAACFTLLAAFRANKWLEVRDLDWRFRVEAALVLRQEAVSASCGDYTLPAFQRNVSKYMKCKQIWLSVRILSLTNPLK
jgi:hypothetical protein